MWWKVYFWIYTVLMILGVISLFFVFSPFTFADWIGTILNIAVYLGLYAYVFNKKDILETKWWTIIFWANLVSWTEALLDLYILNGAIEKALPFLKSGQIMTDANIISSVVISLPALYATYLLGSKNTSTKTQRK